MIDSLSLYALIVGIVGLAATMVTFLAVKRQPRRLHGHAG